MKLRLSILFTLALTTLFAQSPTWLRYPAISPDGSTIAFNYKGDIYLVGAKGGQAQAITTHQDHDFMATWSPDGKTIAFASNRYGNYDVYTMPSNGGAAERITFHSSGDYPYAIENDGSLLFTSTRLDSYMNSQFPSGVLSELYAIDGEGNLDQVLTTPAENASWNKDKTKLIYQDRKGYENQWRKHHTSAVTRDIWMYDPVTKEHTQLTSFNGEDRNPIWSSDEQSFYYLSEKSGSFNVWKKTIAGKTPIQITFFENHPVRFLTMSDKGAMSFSYDGELYTLQEGGEPQKLAIEINNDEDFNMKKLIDVKGEVSEMVLSPNGKEIAFVAHGEIFVTSIDYSDTKRITNTSEQERNISFSPDGRSILFAAERNESWNLYQVKLTREDEKLFYASSVLEEEEVLVTDQETFQPMFSPDGKEVAFLEERVVLRVLNLESKEVRTILEKKYNYSYSDGDQYYEWSPDGKWFLVQYLPFNRWNSDVGLVSSDGKEIINLTESGYDCYSPKWIMGGEAILWMSGRNGMKSHGSWGFQDDAYAMFLTEGSYNTFNLSESEAARLNENEKKDTKEDSDEKSKDKDKDKDKDEKEEIEPLKFDLENAIDRKKRLTIHSSSLSDAIVKKDGSKRQSWMSSLLFSDTPRLKPN